jgi:predicted ATP-grasp superfamily ATP-dependent carboligase
VTFGSLLADVPHTRPAPVTAAATDEALMEELGLEPSRYEGPTGIVGVLLDACRRSGVTSLSLWAAVPHYVSLAPSPRAALALVRRFGELMQIEVDVTELAQAADEYSEQVSEAVASDADTAAYVEELERRVDMLSAEEDLPSGDTLAAELTRFLREREETEEPEEGAEGPAS